MRAWRLSDTLSSSPGAPMRTPHTQLSCPFRLPTLFQLAWAPPAFGATLAVAASDGTLTIWELKVGNETAWRRAGGPWPIPGGADAARPPPLAWAPPAHGPRLGAGGGDGVVRVYVADALIGASRAWELESEFSAGGRPVTALAWRPAADEEEEEEGKPSSPLPALLAAGTASGDAAVWAYRPSLGSWARAAVLEGRAGGSRTTALAWAPRLGRPTELVAAASPASISLHTLSGPSDAPTVRTVATLDAPGVLPSTAGDVSASETGVWALEFDAFGTWLAASLSGRVASAEDAAAAAAAALPLPPRVCLWRPTLAGSWELQGEVVAGEEVAGG